MAVLQRLLYTFAPAFLIAGGILGLYVVALAAGTDPVSFAFLIGYPFMSGIAIVKFKPKGSFKTFGATIAFMLLVMVLAVFGAFILQIEGLICIAIAIVPILFGAALGGTVYLFALRWRASAVKVFTLPVAALVLVSAMPSPPQTLEISDSILIDAPPEIVFNMLKSIPDIQPEEIPTRLSHLIGVPKPTEAKWEEGPDGPVRLSFWGEGVKFRERITHVEENRLIAWNFEFPEGWIAEGIEDPHVKVGGPHLNILSGQYQLTTENGQTRLTLSTRTYESSGLGAYARFWHEFFFDDFHQVILVLVKSRVEASLTPS